MNQHLARLASQARKSGIYVYGNTPTGIVFQGAVWDAVALEDGLLYIDDVIDWGNSEAQIHTVRGTMEDFGGGIVIRSPDGVSLSVEALEDGLAGDKEAIAAATIAHRQRLAREKSEEWRDSILAGRSKPPLSA